MTLSDETSADASARSSRLLNRTGVKLSLFELLTARFWPQNVNLRALWDKAVGDGPIIDEFEVDPYYMLMASRSRPQHLRQACDVLDLSASDIEEWWDRVTWGMQSGRTRFSVVRRIGPEYTV